MRRWAVALMLGCACRGERPDDAGPRRVTERTGPDGPVVALDALPAGAPGLISLVVLDAVRADALELCGGRPGTSAALGALVARGASWTCRAYAPATWTLPSHVTFFTGQDPLTHGQIRKGVRLGDGVETLAETLQARGYQTLMVSANPVLHEGTGVHQGFARSVVANGLVGPLRGDGLVRTVRDELARLDPNRPVFLFVNIFDAHDPYPEVPTGIAGFRPTPVFAFKMELNENNPWQRFMTHALSAADEAAWLAQARETYGWGVASADRALGAVMEQLTDTPWYARGARLVVTSDHGELLGEHGRMRHDGPAWEPVARVPLVVHDTTAAPPTLPEPFAGELVYELTRDGALPAERPVPTSVAVQLGRRRDPRYADAVALWPSATDKLTWVDGQHGRYDLAADPSEALALDVGDHPARAALDALVARQKEAKERAKGARVDAAVMKLLEGVGYVE